MKGNEPRMTEARGSIRRAEVLSITGAATLGGGLALLLGRWLEPFALALLLAGIAAHAWGMYARHRAESQAGVQRAGWEEPVYWLCWITLAGVLLYAFVLA